MKGKLAVLIPAFNGAELLHRSVQSCVSSGLSPDSFSVIVVDNCSSDGSTGKLPASVNGVSVQVHTNTENVGRVANWNRALQLAEDAGFSYAAFLFVGDEWIPNSSIGSLLREMDESGSVLGMAALRIVNTEGTTLRPGARISIRGSVAQIDSHRLLAYSIGLGRLPFAPIQANVYRLFPECPLRFSTDAENALNADIEGSIVFLRNHPGQVSIVSAPFLLWRERRGRFFTQQDPWFVFAESRETLRKMSAHTGLPVDWASANAISLLSALRETSREIPLWRRLQFTFRVLRFLLADPAGLSAARLARFVARKVFSGQSYLDLSEDLINTRASSTTLHPAVDQCQS